MSGHKHAALMAEYAKDAAETEHPWVYWQWRGQSESKWREMDEMPSWNLYLEYRRKPKPAEVWMNFYSDGAAVVGHFTEAEARASAASDATRIAVHMKEVVNNE